ncbi:MAG TPA: cyclic nucleotide-binding domain-containing protein [Actinomycetota bacterium]|nr:cyclic nucleotide-binding domain-containing protein [Actinomycetota bacterium]
MSEGAAERLRRVPLFAELDDDELERVAAVASEFEVPAGHVLIEHGQPGSGMFCITDGSVTVELPGGAVELGPGEFVGELALLADGITRIARVRATTPVKGLALGRAAFAELLEREPHVAVCMLPVLARRLAEAES